MGIVYSSKQFSVYAYSNRQGFALFNKNGQRSLYIEGAVAPGFYSDSKKYLLDGGYSISGRVPKMDIQNYRKANRKRAIHCNKTSGFTLIEILIVVAMVAILTAIAYPSYAEQVRRGVLLEASNQLTTTKVMMDQFYASKRSFTQATSAGGPCVTQTGKAFTLTCVPPNSPNSFNYQLTATGIAGTRAAGFTYTIDHNGTRTMRTMGVTGWPTTANCWLFKKGDLC